MAEGKHETCVMGIDASENSDHAFSWYVENVHREGRHLILLHCIEPLSVVGEVPSIDAYEHVLDESRNKAKELEAKYADKMKSHNIHGKIMALFGSKAGELIVSTATKESASLIICGSRGLGKFRRTVLGSVSDYVLHHAHCPVIVVKDPSKPIPHH